MSVTLRSGHTGLDRAAGAPDPLEARDLRFAYGDRRVLDGIDFRLAPGEIAAVLGPNGSGKSTLLRLLAGLARPAAGEVRWWGQAPEAAPPAVWARVGVVGHGSFLFDDLTAAENLTYYARLLGLREGAAAAREALRREGLTLWADRPARALSRGLAQRVSICRVWLGEPRLVLADEVETGLDPEAAAALRARLEALRARGGAAVLVGHDLRAALALADRYLVLSAGRVADTGAAEPWRGREEAFAERYRAVVAAGRRRGRPLEVGAAAPRGAAAGGGFWRALSAVLWREARLWLRGRERLGALLAFGLLVGLVFGFALDPTVTPLRPVFAGVLWTGALFAVLPPLQRSFAAEWDNDAVLGFRAAGAPPAALFYGKCLVHTAAFGAALLVLAGAFAALLQVRPGAGTGGLALALALGAAGLVPAASLQAAVAARALGQAGGALLPLLALPLLAPGILATVRAGQAALDAVGGAAPWLWLLGAYALLFWALPYALFPVVLEG